ncbi:MAG TPA: Smr/MutS family protein [Spirochaetota bacterium]|nr:Smr/MutS family protein [Spirochaetota bacterium]HQQ24453.1 Smr/MutS family protein [Spirochaetota bacterium]
MRKSAVSEFDGELDLHCFASKDIPFLLEVLIEESLRDGLKSIVIIHGKGLFHKKKIVHDILSKDPRIISFSDDGSNYGRTVAFIACA